MRQHIYSQCSQCYYSVRYKGIKAQANPVCVDISAPVYTVHVHMIECGWLKEKGLWTNCSSVKSKPEWTGIIPISLCRVIALIILVILFQIVYIYLSTNLPWRCQLWITVSVRIMTMVIYLFIINIYKVGSEIGVRKISIMPISELSIIPIIAFYTAL